MCLTYNVILFFFFLLFRAKPMEIPRLGVDSELQLPAYTVAHGDVRFLLSEARD